MEIVAFDEDDRADGTGKAGITWISKDLLNTTRAMNSTIKTVDGATGYTAGGWEHSDMRTYVKSLKSQLPTALQNGIVNVTKVQSIYDGSAKVVNGQTTTDDLWIPSNHETLGRTSHESIGARYSNITTIIKKCNGLASNWVFRSVDDANNFCNVRSDGRIGSTSGQNIVGVALGFCTN